MKVYGVERATSCCGLTEFHGLHAPHGWTDPIAKEVRPSSYKRGMAYFATTTRDMRTQVKALKAAGFREVGSWRNANTKRTLTMWVKNVKRRKKSGTKR